MQQLEKTYNLDALRRRVPVDRAELFLGFTPWPEDTEGRRRSVRESHSEVPGRPLYRTIWDHPEARDARVLIDVAEGSSVEEAVESLIGRLESNQLARLPEGPGGLGIASFVHPEGAPPAAFFARGNLCVSVVSFAGRAVDVLPLAQRLDRRLEERPKVERGILSILPELPRAKVGEAVSLAYTLPWKLGEDGYIKFFVSGGTLTRRERRLFLTGTKAGEVSVEAFVVEPGREPYFGRTVLNVE